MFTHWLLALKVYDVTEELVKAFGPPIGRQYYGTEPQRKFETQLNEVFGELGIGWQMVGGQIQTRGTEVFEDSIQKAKTALVESGRPTAESELREAIADLSRRPEPDLTGAMQHSMAALECVARDVCRQPSRTLGDLLQTHPTRVIEHAVRGMLPKNRLGRAIYKNMHVYAGTTHPHEAQKPKKIEL